MKKILTSKKIWLILLVFLALIVGFFIYFFLFGKEPKISLPTKEVPEEIRVDKIPPSTAIISPEDKSWWNRDFEIEIEDSDLGSGLADFVPMEKGCRYLIIDLGTGRASGGFRKCDPVKIDVSVGENKICSSSYQKNDPSQGKCKVSTMAYDKAGNNSGWKSKIFNIDLIKPQVGEISLPPTLKLNQNYLFKATISDNNKIDGCWFYVNGKLVNLSTKINPIPCQNGEECSASLNYKFDKEGEYSIRFGCSDRAGNLSFGNPVIAKVTTNHPPKISFCQVNPTRGTIQTQFQFNVEALDPDGNEIFYLWDFGDGQVSNKKDPQHFYQNSGIFKPRVIVFDGQGGESQCQTAWVVIGE